jgi:hypothetical protein
MGPIDFDKITPADVIGGQFFSDGKKSDAQKIVAGKDPAEDVMAMMINPNDQDMPEPQAAMLFPFAGQMLESIVKSLIKIDAINGGEKEGLLAGLGLLKSTWKAVVKRKHREAKHDDPNCDCQNCDTCDLKPADCECGKICSDCGESKCEDCSHCVNCEECSCGHDCDDWKCGGCGNCEKCGDCEC